MRWAWHLLICLFWASMVFKAHAQVFELTPIEVQGSALELFEGEPSSCSVIFPSEYEGEFKDLGELLSKVPGVYVTRLGGRGSYTLISIRGSTSAQVAVYLNGVLLNSGEEGGVDLSTIPLTAVERVEVYRGSVPARFGIPGIGGVINIVTSEEHEFKTIKATMGSFRSYALEGISTIKRGMFSINMETSKGDYSYFNDNGTPYNPDDDYEARRHNNAYRLSDVKISKRLGKDSSIFLNYFSKHRELPKPAPASDKEDKISHSNLSQERLIAEFSQKLSFSEKLKGNISFYGIYSEKEFLNPYGDVGWEGQRHNWYNSHKIGAQLSLNYLMNDSNFVEAYLNLFKEGFIPGGDIVSQGEVSPLGGLNNYERETFSFSLDYTYTSGKFSIIPWIRFISVSDRSEFLDNEVISSTSDSFSHGLRFRYTINENWSLKTTWGKYIRIPNFYEKFGDGAFIIANPSLKNEKGENFDLGLEYRDERLIGYITYFRSDVDDLIEFVMLNPKFGRYINIEGAKIYGVETGVTCFIKGGWNLSLSYTYMETKSEVPGYRREKPLPNRPEHNLTLRVSKSWKGFEAFAEGNFISENYFDTGGLVKFSDWWSLNVGISYRLSDKEKLSLVINNITDNQDLKIKPAFGFGPERIADYPPVGRSFYLTYIKNF
ncbi:MAG: vitamin transporter [bacterium]|nr:MAG: Outer membrane receptor for ferrienterochelin and colicin [bacterium 42_11]MDK2872003.1 vitamin transporter [bacterium]